MYRSNQNGAVAIEFAVLFSLFFIVLYSVVAYSIPLLINITFKQLSADAAREIYKVNPVLSVVDYRKVANDVVVDYLSPASGKTWLPEKWRSPCYGSEYVDVKEVNGRFEVDVCIQYDYANKPIVPSLNFFGFEIPSISEKLQGRTHTRI